MMTEVKPCKPTPNLPYGRAGVNDRCCLRGRHAGHRLPCYNGHITVGADSLIVSALNDFKADNLQVALYRMQREVILMTSPRVQDELYVVAWTRGEVISITSRCIR